MDKEKINEIRLAAHEGAMAGIANKLADLVFPGESGQKLKKHILEVAFVLNFDYGNDVKIVDDYIHALYKDLNDKEADKTDNCDMR